MATHTFILTLCIVAATALVHGFAPSGFGMPSHVRQSPWAQLSATCQPLGRSVFSSTAMWNAEDDSAESVDDFEEDELSDAVDETSQEEEEEEEKEEDPEMVALKEEIASLEKVLKTKRSDASKLEEEADSYTKTGYYRKVAEMDNFRKQRDVAFQNSKHVARAWVIQKFLPVMEELDELGGLYKEDEFGKQYDALRRDLHNVMEKKLDLEQFDVAEGDPHNRAREAVVGYEISDTVPRWDVVRQVSPGLEVKGNVVRFAEVIISKGTEEDERKAQEEEAAKLAEEAEGVVSDDDEGEVTEEPSTEPEME